MNAKYRAKQRTARMAALLLAAWLIPQIAASDDGNLTQQMQIQQQKSQFQLMLEQVAERARRRGASGPALTPAAVPTTDLGNGTQTVRLQPVTVTGRQSPQIDHHEDTRLRALQAYDRDQRRILDHRQQQRALIGRARTRGPIGVNSFQVKRRQLVRFNVQSQRQTLQRKLRR